MKWEAGIVGNPEGGVCEIAIIRDDFEHGFKSFGWAGEKKIIIASLNKMPNSIALDILKVAQKWALWLSEHGIENPKQLSHDSITLKE